MNKYITIALIVLAVLLIYIFRTDLLKLLPKTQAATPPIAPGTPPPAGLDQNKILKNGSRGEEVRFLQGMLGVTTDGIFGPQTEAALFAKKGVKQTTLAQYPQLADVSGTDTDTDTGIDDDSGKWYDYIPFGHIFS